MSVKKALIIEIDKYVYERKLYGCVNDAKTIDLLLSKNFDTQILIDQ